MHRQPGRILVEDGEIYFEGVVDRAKLAADGVEDLDGDKIFKPIRALARSLDKVLEDLGPDEVTIETSAKISGKVGLVFTSVDAESAFRVTFKWKK